MAESHSSCFSFPPWLKYLSNGICDFADPTPKEPSKQNSHDVSSASAHPTAAPDYSRLWESNAGIRLEVNWVMNCYWRKLVIASVEIHVQRQGAHKPTPATVPITYLIWFGLNLVWEPTSVLCVYLSINAGLIASIFCLSNRHIKALLLATPQGQGLAEKTHEQSL